MERHKLEPLTEEEKMFAEHNHNLVYSFLHKHGYSIEGFYSIAIQGYLKAVQVYHIKEEIREKCTFGFVSYQYMRAEISNYFRTKKSQKRIPQGIIISLDSEYEEMGNSYNCVGRNSAESNVMEKILIESIMKNLSDVQREILLLKVEGHNNKEMFMHMGMTEKAFYKEMHIIKEVASGLMVGSQLKTKKRRN